MRYAFLIYVEESQMHEPDPDDLAGHVALTRDAIASGAYLMCDALQPAAAATTVRVRNGATLTADGPFAETKEILGGLYLLDCRDLAEAIGYAERMPPAKIGSIEIRPIMEIPGWDEMVGLAPANARA